jgi:hydrogenase nickel incorporation protein HypA/HybF
MHEVGLMQSLLKMIDTYSREYRLRKISRVVLQVGKLSNAAPEALQFAFEAISPGTLADGAELVIEQVDGRFKCITCGLEFASIMARWACPECDQPVVIIAGQELHLQTLEGDQEDEANGD